MGMSYRRAWLLVDPLNALFDQPVIATKHGGQGGGGAELTGFGSRVVQRYHATEAKAHAAVAADLAVLAAVTVRPAPDP
jgi:molybdate transport system regulatory protein